MAGTANKACHHISASANTFLVDNFLFQDLLPSSLSNLVGFCVKEASHRKFCRKSILFFLLSERVKQRERDRQTERERERETYYPFIFIVTTTTNSCIFIET